MVKLEKGHCVIFSSEDGRLRALVHRGRIGPYVGELLIPAGLTLASRCGVEEFIKEEARKNRLSISRASGDEEIAFNLL